MKLWHRLRNRQLGGWKFVRQAPLGEYFADFLCREARLVLEVDGGTHSEDHEIERDLERTSKIEALGYRVVRVWNREIDENLDGFLTALLATLESSRAEKSES
jgi:very-short-patch-repair endonuclease